MYEAIISVTSFMTMIAATGTMIAAALGLQRWKEQVKYKSKHEMALKLFHAIGCFRSAVQENRRNHFTPFPIEKPWYFDTIPASQKFDFFKREIQDSRNKDIARALDEFMGVYKLAYIQFDKSEVLPIMDSILLIYRKLTAAQCDYYHNVPNNDYKSLTSCNYKLPGSEVVFMREESDSFSNELDDIINKGKQKIEKYMR